MTPDSVFIAGIVFLVAVCLMIGFASQLLQSLPPHPFAAGADVVALGPGYEELVCFRGKSSFEPRVPLGYTISAAIVGLQDGDLWIAGLGNLGGAPTPGILTAGPPSAIAQTWTTATGDVFGVTVGAYMSGVRKVGATYVAVGDDTGYSVATSTNGTTWASVTENVDVANLYGVVNDPLLARTYAIGVYTGGGSIVIYADDSDLTTWNTLETQTFAYGGSDIEVGAGLLVVGGQESGSGGDTHTLAWSDDGGATWNQGTGDRPDVIATYVVWNGTRFVASGQDSTDRQLVYSDNGIQWTKSVNQPFTDFGDALVWKGGLWYCAGQDLAPGNNGKIAVSRDGASWTVVSQFTSANPTNRSYALM